MKDSGPKSYTAAQIALAWGVSRQATFNALANTPADSTALVRGKAVAAWSFTALPERIRAQIASRSFANGQSIAELLESCPLPWDPPVPLSDIAAADIEQAGKLRAALVPAMQRMDSTVLDSADRVRLGLADYERALGHAISERHWRRLIDRTLRRDGGENDFERLQLYLPEKPARKSPARLTPGEADFKQLRDSIQSFADPTAPTRKERAAFWCEIFDLYESGAATNRAKRRLRRELVKFLFRHAPWLAKSSRALRVAFERKHAVWSESDGSAAALIDGREGKRGLPTAEPIPQDDLDRITFHAARNCGGRIAQAVRDFATRGGNSGLSNSTLEIIAPDAASKSYVNRRLMQAIKTDVRNIRPYLLGKKAIDDATAHLERDYSKLVSMQVVCADDFTFPVYFYVPDGNGWFTLTRGQCLMMLDVRSWKIIAWSLQPERNFNALVIRTLMNRVCSGWGLPKAWYFERGIWQRSKLVKGGAPSGWQDALSEPETKVGWENIGVRFVHATRARSKPVQRVGGLMQDLMEGVRGYCGRDERRDCPIVTKRAMDDVQARRVTHPGELFLSFAEWETELGAAIDRYNAASQDGQILQGLSPDEAFEKNWPHIDPPAKLDANCWHLVAHYVKPVPVTANGISFRLGNRKFVYRDERTGQDRGKTVLAWFDPECPELLCVTDLNRRNPYLVERSTKVDFLAEPGDETFAHEIAKAAAHSAYPKARFHVLKAKFAPTFRRNVVDVATAETAQSITQQRETILARQSEESRVRNAYTKNRMALPNRLNPDAVDDFKRLDQLRRKAYSEPVEETQ